MLCVTEGETAVPDIDTESNGTVASEDDISSMTDAKRTKLCYQHLLSVRPVTVNDKLPQQDDVRAIIAADFHSADELWKIKAAKNVVLRLDYQLNNNLTKLLKEPLNRPQRQCSIV